MIKQFDNGNQLMAFTETATATVPAEHANVPLTASFVVARQEDVFLLVRNVKRDQWECPGGGIEPGETADEAAHRELWEESGQRAASLSFVGLLRFFVARTATTEHFAYYRGEVGTLRPFTPNAEIDQIRLWRPGDTLSGRQGGISAWLIDHTLKFG